MLLIMGSRKRLQIMFVSCNPFLTVYHYSDLLLACVYILYVQ